MLRERLKKEQQSGFLALLFSIIFTVVFSLMFTPFIGIPVALICGLFIHFMDEEDD